MKQRSTLALAPATGDAGNQPSAPRLGIKAKRELRAAALKLEAAIRESNRLDAATLASATAAARIEFDNAYVRHLDVRARAGEALVAACNRHGVDGVQIGDNVLGAFSAELVKCGSPLDNCIAFSLAKVVRLDS